MAIDEGQRASPEALLALAKKEGRGKLKIFLGAAPGVGKTYAMLAATRAAKTGLAWSKITRSRQWRRAVPVWESSASASSSQCFIRQPNWQPLLDARRRVLLAPP